MKNLVLSVLTASCLAAFASDDELPDAFNATTGYVLQQQADTTGGAAHPSFITNNVGSTATYGSWNEEAPNPHAGTNYCVTTSSSAGTLVTPNVSGLSANKTWTFGGDKLVINGATLQNMSSGKNYPCIPELYMLKGGAINWFSGKNVLTGNCHIRCSTLATYGTWGGPVRFYSNAGIDPQSFGMVVDGDADQKVVFLTSKNGSGAQAARSTHFKMTASWADYHGTILVTNNCPEYGLVGWTKLSMTGPEVPARVTVATNCAFASLTPNMNLVGLTVRTHWAFNIAADGTWTIGDLALANTMRVSFASDTSRLVVTNTLTRAPGATFQLEMPYLETRAMPAVDLPLVTFGSEVDLGDLSPEDFVINGVTSTSTGLPHYTTSIETNAQNQVQLVLHRSAIITHNSKAVDVATGSNLWYHAVSTNGVSFWSDGLAVHAGADYLYQAGSTQTTFPLYANASVEGSTTDNAYVFPGDSLTVACEGVMFYTGNPGVGIIDFRRLFLTENMSLRTYGTHPTIDGLVTLRFLAPMYITSDKVLTSTPYSSRNQRYEGEVSGPGNIELGSYRGASAEGTNQGSSEFLGTNVAFTGRISFNHDYYTKVDGGVTKYTIPNERVYCKLFARDGRSLGGPLADFDYDSLWLRHWGCFVPRNSVTLNQANRGVHVSDVGQIQLDKDVKLAILNPLTLWGTLRVGAKTATGGTLALGGPLRLVRNNTVTDLGGPDPIDSPTNNIMIVSNVCVQALATNAFDGAALTLKGGAGIVVDPCATGDLAAYGLLNLRGTVTVANGEGAANTIPVRIEASSAPTRAECAPAICTVPKGSALTTASFTVGTLPKGYRSLGVTLEETDATKTFRLTLRRKGLSLILR